MRFRKVVKEIDNTLEKIFLFDELLNAIIIFLGVYIVLALVRFYPYIAIAPGILYMTIAYIEQKKKDKERMVEKKYTMLNEKLRTARDYADVENNPVVSELQEEVVQDIKKVRVSSFFNTKKETYKIFGCVVLSFLVVIIAVYDISFFDLKLVFDNIKMPSLKGGDGTGKGIGEETTGGSAESQDIYGAESVAKLGNRELKIEIKPVSYEMDIKEIEEPPRKEFQETFPEEVFLTASAGLEEEIPVEQQELVKTYFEKIAKG